MCSMAAEYECVETAAAALCPTVPLGEVDLHTAASCSYNTGKLSAAATIQWLQENYVEAEGISLPRGALYGHYLDFCQDTGMEAVNQATFGKIIRAVFVSVRTRRLGTRGQSKYHYYGLAIKDTSSYKEVMKNTQRINNLPCGPGKPQHSRTIAQSNLPSGLPINGTPLSGSLAGGVLLHDFPAMSSVSVPAEIHEQTSVFLMMYKHHCQRIVDTVLRANFSEVKEFVVHFWQSLPSHISGVLTQRIIVDLIVLCDTSLYRAICSLLIPGLLQPLPTSLATAIRGFAEDMLSWMQEALKSQPKLLRKRKLAVAKTYSACLKRQTAVSHMASMARTFLHSAEMIRKLQQDWQQLNMDCFILEAQSHLQLRDPLVRNALQKYLIEFGRLLSQQTTIDRYMEWLRNIINQCVFKKCKDEINDEKQHLDINSEGSQFLMCWTQASRIIIRDLTLDNAEMFGAYHLLSLLFQDYILCLLEEHQREDAHERLRIAVYGEEQAKTLAQKKDDNAVIQPDSPPSSWSTTYPSSHSTAPPHVSIKQPLPWEIEPDFPAINPSHTVMAGEFLTVCHGQVDKDMMICRPDDVVTSSDRSETDYTMHSCSFVDSMVTGPQTSHWPNRNLSQNNVPYKSASLHKPTPSACFRVETERAVSPGKTNNSPNSLLSFSGNIQVKGMTENAHCWWAKDVNPSSLALLPSQTPGGRFEYQSSVEPYNCSTSGRVSLSQPPNHTLVGHGHVPAPVAKSFIGVFPDHGQSTCMNKQVNLASNSSQRPEEWVSDRDAYLLVSGKSDINHFPPSPHRFPIYHHSSKLGSINVV